MTRVLVVAYDAVGPRMAGPGIRARALSQALATEHEVVLACRHEPSPSADGFRLVHAPDPATLMGILTREHR